MTDNGNGDIFLDILQCESKGLIKVDIGLESMDQQKIMQDYTDKLTTFTHKEYYCKLGW